MVNVNIEKLSFEETVKLFLRSKNTVDVLSNLNDLLRDRLIKFYELEKDKNKFNRFGLSITVTTAKDWEATKAAWIGDGKILPSRIIPAHEEIDMAKFKALIKKNPKFLKEMENKTYTLKRLSGKK